MHKTIQSKIFKALLLIRLSGLFPYDSSFHFSIFLSVLSLIILFTPLGIFSYYIVTAEEIRSVQDQLALIVNKFLIFLYLVVIISCFVYRKSLKRTFLGVESFDAWTCHEFKADNKLKTFWIFVILNISLVVSILIVCYTDYEIPFSSFEVSYWIMWLVIDLHMRKLQIIFALVESRFLVLTKNLIDKPDKCIEFLNCYGILERVTISANRMFGVLLVVHMLVSWMSFLTEAYAVLSTLISMLSKAHKRREYNLYLILLTTTFFFLQLFSLAYQKERTNGTARNFNKTLYHISIKDKFKGFYQNNYVLMHLAKKKGIYMSAMGFFHLDFTFIESIILTSSTYLVVLIQFYVDHEKGRSSHSKCMNNITVTGMASQ